MDVHYSDKLNQAFVVSPDHLKKLVELLQRRIGKVDISADCVDEIKREFKTIQDLIAYENSKLKEIHSIHLKARSDDYSKSTMIVFRRHSWLSSGISIDANGREDVILRLKEEILDIIKGMRPWYRAIAHTDLVLGFLILWFILVIIVGAREIFIPDSSTSDSAASVSSAKGFAIISLFFFCAWGLDRLRAFLFPLAVFTIGQEESRFKLLEKVRWIVISLVSGLLLWILRVVTG